MPHLAALATLLTGCSDQTDPHGEVASLGPFRAAATCGACHPQHFEEWKSSMHAFGGVDPVMIAAAVACLPIFFTGHLIARWEGGLFFFYYLAYMAYLVMDATEHRAEADFAAVMLLFVMPLTLLTLLICSFRAWRERSRAADSL